LDVRWLRLAFGLSVAPEVWTSRIQASVSDLRGVYCIADDLICTGSGPDIATATRDHDANLIALLNRCRAKGLKLNREKFRLNRSVVSFMGHELTTAGLRADPRKVKAIQDMPIPADRAALQRVIGFANFLARYCPMYSEITAPLRELLTAQNEYCWDVRHTEAFNRLKSMLASPPVLQYFAPNKDITIQADSSIAGIGAILVQGGKVGNNAAKYLVHDFFRNATNNTRHGYFMVTDVTLKEKTGKVQLRRIFNLEDEENAKPGFESLQVGVTSVN
jgi:hypothetical protein